jgi:hypothetical protein
MQREEFLKRVGTREEADTRERGPFRPPFATADRPVRGDRVRDIRRKSPLGPGQPFA